jgi:hypothetical protein
MNGGTFFPAYSDVTIRDAYVGNLSHFHRDGVHSFDTLNHK